MIRLTYLQGMPPGARRRRPYPRGQLTSPVPPETVQPKMPASAMAGCWGRWTENAERWPQLSRNHSPDRRSETMRFPPVGTAFAWRKAQAEAREAHNPDDWEINPQPMARASPRRLPISMVKNSTVSLGSGISCLLVGLGPLSLARGPQLVTAATPSPPPSSCTKWGWSQCRDRF